MNRTKIEWTDYTWNPIKGLCPVNCKTPDGYEYCYARKIYKRFHPDWPPENINYPDLLKEPKMPSKPSKIFVCSTFEIFHPYVHEYFRDIIFGHIKRNPQHTFQILTKMPENIDRPMPDNVWLGTSITGEDKEVDWKRISYLESRKSSVKFISFEPLLKEIDEEALNSMWFVNWIIIGKLGGYGKKHNPGIEWINGILEYAEFFDIPPFMKNNLKDIWGEDLIQEFPE